MWCRGFAEATNQDLGKGAPLQDRLLALGEMGNYIQLVGRRSDFSWRNGRCGVEKRAIEPGDVAVLEPSGRWFISRCRLAWC